MPSLIRPARADDAAPLSELMVGAILHNNGADYPPDVIARLLRRHTPAVVGEMIGTRRVFVASEADRIVGTIALEADVLRGLFVAVASQARGLAVVLVRHVEDLARDEGVATLALQSSTTAHGFYERLGYRTQAFRFHPNGSTYRMVKRLASGAHIPPLKPEGPPDGPPVADCCANGTSSWLTPGSV